MSSDFLLAIKADRNTCKPYTGTGWIGHVVRVSLDPDMTIINEFQDGGQFEHEDCAPASLQSWFRDRTNVRTSIGEIELLAGTDLNGTGFTGLIVAGQHFGYEIKFSGDNPTPGYVMNPGGGFIEPLSAFGSYLAASQGGCLVLPNVAPAPTPPQPTPQPSPEEDDQPMFAIINRTDKLGSYIWQEDGNVVHINNTTDLAALAKLKNCAGTAPVSVETYQALAAAAPNLRAVSGAAAVEEEGA